MTDALLEEERPVVSLQSAAAARSLIVELAYLGVIARFAEGPNYNPQKRLASALLAVEPMLATEDYQTCQAMSAHGEWQLALSHCLAKLQPVDPRLKEQFTALAELAVEFGIWDRGQA